MENQTHLLKSLNCLQNKLKTWDLTWFPGYKMGYRSWSLPITMWNVWKYETCKIENVTVESHYWLTVFFESMPIFVSAVGYSFMFESTQWSVRIALETKNHIGTDSYRFPLQAKLTQYIVMNTWHLRNRTKWKTCKKFPQRN